MSLKDCDMGRFSMDGLENYRNLNILAISDCCSSFAASDGRRQRGGPCSWNISCISASPCIDLGCIWTATKGNYGGLGFYPFHISNYLDIWYLPVAIFWGRFYVFPENRNRFVYRCCQPVRNHRTSMPNHHKISLFLVSMLCTSIWMVNLGSNLHICCECTLAYTIPEKDQTICIISNNPFRVFF